MGRSQQEYQQGSRRGVQIRPFKWTCEGAEGVHTEWGVGGTNEAFVEQSPRCPGAVVLQNQNSQNQQKLFSLFCSICLFNLSNS